MSVLGLILAGGAARRMGGHEKAMLELAGVPLIRHVHARFAPQVDRLALSARQDFGLGLPVIPDRPSGVRGPLAGIAAVLAWLEDGHARNIAAIATVPVDTPFLPHDLVARLAAAGGAAVAESEAGLQPIFGYWPVAALREAEELFARPDGAAMAALADATGARHVRFDKSEAFLNINRPEDLEAAEAFAARTGRGSVP